MLLVIDSANVEDIRELIEYYRIDGNAPLKLVVS
jgi:hypothetical protein